MKKQFIAKLLVLCMVVSMLPMAVFAVEPNEAAPVANGTYETGDDTYSIQLDAAVTNGQVLVYKTSTDTEPTVLTTTTNSVYANSDDAVYIKLQPDDGYEVGTSEYTMGDGARQAIPSDAITVNGNIRIYATFVSTSSGGSSGGGSSSSPDKVTVEEPATSGGTTTVEVKVDNKTSGSTTTATVSKKDMDNAVNSAVEAADAAGTAPAIVVKVETSDKTTAVNVNLPVKSLETLSQAEGATLNIISDVADVALDSASTAALAEQATGSTVTLSVKPATALNNAQKEAVEDATVIDVTVTSGGKQITSFGGGVLAISVKYALPDGVAAADVQVFYLTDSGILQSHETSYSGGKVTFTTTHLSKYVIGTKSLAGMVFEDVAFGQYYYDAVAWAAKAQITAGVSATMFAPDKTCTRAEIVSFLWRSAGSPEPAAKANPFTDVASDAYYYKAVMWAVEKGITAGTTETTFSPDKTCTRAEAMAFLYRSEGSPAASGVGSFTDVPADAYYNSAVAWAVKSNITAGTSETTFSPDKTCSRAEIVTFLYRNVV